jgi:uncharacterized membrane protein YebE (DUF533 family)
MFDARSILDILLGGGPRPRGRQVDPTVFKDMLDQLGDQPSTGRPSDATQQAPGGNWTELRYPQSGPQSGQAPGGQTMQPAPGGPGGAPGGPLGIEDLLRTILTGRPPEGQPAPQQAPTSGGQASRGPQQPGPTLSPEVGKELQDLLRQILQGAFGGPGQQAGGGQGGVRGAVKTPVDTLLGEAGGPGAEGAQGGGKGGQTGLGEALTRALGQATEGLREGAAKIDETTGLSTQARETLQQATGQTPEEFVARLNDLIARNQLAAGAALGGLGALVLGTRAGRSLAATAVRLGGLALVGGLAYKAYQNYQHGTPVAGEPEKHALLPAPEGSGFEADALSDDAARRCIRAMIAAAAADGRIDGNEQQKILGGLHKAGLERSAEQFLAAEINNPANVAELAAGVASPEEAVQVYTAARIAVDPDTLSEHAFLSSLADALGVDDQLAAQIDAATREAVAAG